jgi:hypothetical protein
MCGRIKLVFLSSLLPEVLYEICASRLGCGWVRSSLVPMHKGFHSKLQQDIKDKSRACQ